jgi:HD-like signal output (HDOD) protein
MKISTAFYDAMFGQHERVQCMTRIEQEVLDKVRNILNCPDKLSNQIPPLPIILIQLLDKLQDKNADFIEVADIIEHDPALAATILKTANSPLYYRGNEPICSLRKAISLLGMTEVTSIASTIMVEKIRPPQPIYYKLFGRQIWVHSVCCAFMCRTLAGTCGEDEFNAHFIGLIHDIGKIIVFNCLCEAFSSSASDSSPGSQIFKEIMSEMSTDISSFVAQEWNLPSLYCEALAQQRSKKVSPLAKILYKANLLCEIYLLFTKNMICEKQIADLLEKMSLESTLWQDFVALVAEIEQEVT